MGHGGEIFIFDMGQPVKNMGSRNTYGQPVGPARRAKTSKSSKLACARVKTLRRTTQRKELTLPTHHKKIMIARVRTYDYQRWRATLELLRQALDRGFAHDIVVEMKHIVPEFKSINSRWQ